MTAAQPVKRYRTSKPAPYLRPEYKARAERRVERYVGRLERQGKDYGEARNFPFHILRNVGMQ